MAELDPSLEPTCRYYKYSLYKGQEEVLYIYIYKKKTYLSKILESDLVLEILFTTFRKEIKRVEDMKRAKDEADREKLKKMF